MFDIGYYLPLDKLYYGNSVGTWLQALLLIGLFYLGSKLLFYFITRIVERLAAKTKNTLDDLIVSLIKKPSVFFVTLVGVKIGFDMLSFSESFTTFVDHVITFIFAFAIGWLIARIVDAIIAEYLEPLTKKTDNDLDDQIVPIVRKITKFIIIIVALLIGLDNIGYDITALIAGLGIGGLALAMASKETIGNFFGGLTVFADKMFKRGDRVKVAGYDGFVEEIGIRSTRVRTFDGSMVIVPNAMFTTDAIENVSEEPTKKTTVTLGVTYDTPPKKLDLAKKLIKDLLKKQKGIKEDPIVVFSNFNSSSLDIMVIYHITDKKNFLAIRDEVNMNILKAFTKNKIEFAFPTQTIHLQK
ncbi:MAG: mechanosensitive ion channel family protein [Candidatus Woesearchaeota archaeon]|nr:MAG: mechanosensitive ion channel family protein [Candidatus Woesearchaeota archaeon]